MRDWLEIVNDGNIFDKAIFVGIVTFSLIVVSLCVSSVLNKI